MKHPIVQVRVKESQESKLNEIREKLKLKDNSEALRKCIDITYGQLFEDGTYLINFYDLKKSKLYKMKVQRENKDA